MRHPVSIDQQGTHSTIYLKSREASSVIFFYLLRLMSLLGSATLPLKELNSFFVVSLTEKKCGFTGGTASVKMLYLTKTPVSPAC